MVNPRFRIFRINASHALTAALAVLAVYLLASQWPELRHNPSALALSLRTSLGYVLLTWTAVAFVLLGVYLVSSSEETSSILRAALLAAVPAMWFVPAMLLLGIPSPLSIAAALLLIANSVRVLISRSLSRRDFLNPPRRQSSGQLFSYSRLSAANRQTTIVVLGTLAIQVGIVAAGGDYAVIAAVLVGTGAMIWTLAAISRGVFEPRKAVDSSVRAIFTLLIAILIAANQIPSDTMAESDPDSHPKSTRKNVTHVFTEDANFPAAARTMAEGVEGVLLRPEIIRPRLTFSVAKPRRVLPTSPTGFRFTGEYQLFPLSSRALKKDWSVETGTPIDSVYATMSGRPLETEAYQALDPPLDFSRVHKLQLTLVSHQGDPAAATVELIGNNKLTVLGPEIFGLDRTPEETLEFAIPGSQDGSQVSGIRIVFQCIGGKCSQSIRVAVQGFKLIVS